MKNDYHFNYIESINQGLLKTQYCVDSIAIDSKLFYKEVKDLLIKLRNNGGKIYFFGNGASASFANHMALDFSKNGKILSRSLSDSALLTALSNDYSFEEAMVEFLKIEEVSDKDLVITISSSGNSKNIVNVLNHCRDSKILTLSFSGLNSTNKSISLSKYSIYVPCKTYGMVECIHQILLHLILDHSMEIFEWDREGAQNMDAKNFQL